MKYKFLGKPDRIFPNLKHNKIYDLEIREYSKGLFGSLVGNTYPVIINPIRCPYRSWDTFFENWERI